jgi:hypothetical protein
VWQMTRAAFGLSAIVLLQAISGVALLGFAVNVSVLCFTWVLTTGCILGLALGMRTPRTGYALVLVGAALPLACVAMRALPVFALGWAGIDKVAVEDPNGVRIEITDAGVLKALEAYAGRGHYATIWKSGRTIPIVVTQRTTSQAYYVHGDMIGSAPGGYMQSAFVPSKPGFGDFLASIAHSDEGER